LQQGLGEDDGGQFDEDFGESLSWKMALRIWPASKSSRRRWYSWAMGAGQVVAMMSSQSISWASCWHSYLASAVSASESDTGALAAGTGDQ
jgi:hypothetical protein